MEGKEKETVSLREEERKRATQIKGLEGEVELLKSKVIELDTKYLGDVKKLAEVCMKLRTQAAGCAEVEDVMID